MPFSYYEINIDILSRQKETACYNLTLKAINSLESQFLWGTQPPNVYGETLLLVNDTLEPRRGPAWWLQVTYDKIVVVDEDKFSAKSKRWGNLDGPVVDHGVIRANSASIGAKNGDKPWICTWPDTLLEVFIYPIQNTSSPSHPNSTTSSVSNPFPTDGLHFYPKQVKFLESRVVDETSKAYCRQVQIFNNGQSMKNVTDSFGNPIVVEIDEDYESDQQKAFRPKRDRRSVRRSWNDPWVSRQVYDLTPCGCLWWSPSVTTPQ